MEKMKQVLGDNHPDTLMSMANLASTYRNQGHWKEAEMLQVVVMEKRKQVLGDDHPDTLTSMANLATTCTGTRGAGRRQRHSRWWSWRRGSKCLEMIILSTLASMANLASTYKK